MRQSDACGRERPPGACLAARQGGFALAERVVGRAAWDARAVFARSVVPASVLLQDAALHQSLPVRLARLPQAALPWVLPAEPDVRLPARLVELVPSVPPALPGESVSQASLSLVQHPPVQRAVVLVESSPELQAAPLAVSEARPQQEMLASELLLELPVESAEL